MDNFRVDWYNRQNYCLGNRTRKNHLSETVMVVFPAGHKIHLKYKLFKIFHVRDEVIKCSIPLIYIYFILKRKLKVLYYKKS